MGDTVNTELGFGLRDILHQFKDGTALAPGAGDGLLEELLAHPGVALMVELVQDEVLEGGTVAARALGSFFLVGAYVGHQFARTRAAAAPPEGAGTVDRLPFTTGEFVQVSKTARMSAGPVVDTEVQAFAKDPYVQRSIQDVINYIAMNPENVRGVLASSMIACAELGVYIERGRQALRGVAQ
jgi:hypothetical protein